MSSGILTPLQLIAGAGLLQNQGLSISPVLSASADAYLATPLLAAYTDALDAGAYEIYNISGNSVPAFTNAVPASYSSYVITATATFSSITDTTLVVNSTANIFPNMVITGTGFISGQTVISVDNSTTLTISATSDTTPSGTLTFTGSWSDESMTGLVLRQSTADFGGDLSKFIQALNLVLAYSDTSNLFINSAVNSQTYLANTFTTTNDSITGDLTAVNLATSEFGRDLENLGVLIDLNDLENLGSPLALVQRLVAVAGSAPILAVAFLLEGVPQETVVNISNPTLSVTDSVQKLMYQAMTKITGDALEQILSVLRVTTTGIETVADLLNPIKLFPNSFQSLTAPTANGPRAIYINSSGTVNSSLVDELPPYVINTIV
jgi:hypothetical protein